MTSPRITRVSKDAEGRLVLDCEDTCILDCDSPSYPPTDEERVQCGCRQCLTDLERSLQPRPAGG